MVIPLFYSEKILYNTNFQQSVTTDTSLINNFKIELYMSFHQWKRFWERICSFWIREKEPEKKPTSENSLLQHIYKKCFVPVWLQEVIPFLEKKGLGFIWGLQHDNTLMQILQERQ